MINHIGVLVDFTDVCNTSLNYAKSIALKAKARISLIHVAEKSTEGLDEKFAPYVTSLESSGLVVDTIAESGKFERVVASLVENQAVQLVIVGTHGVKGIKQHLFGSNILHLTRKLPVTTIVVQEKSSGSNAAVPKILFPMSAHSNFSVKVNETGKLAKLMDGEVIIYMIEKPGVAHTEEMENNNKLAIKLFKEADVNHSVVTQEAIGFSFGYGKQIVQFANENKVDFIAIMSSASSNEVILPDAEKEGMILNEHAIPVICIND